jgi:hypothetical protein
LYSLKGLEPCYTTFTLRVSCWTFTIILFPFHGARKWRKSSKSSQFL